MGKGGMLSLTGFEDLAEALNKAEKSVDVEGRKCFEKCAENVYGELVNNAEKAGLAKSLIGEITKEYSDSAGHWRFKCGWKKTGYDPKNPSAWAKVAFFNYGTPRRTTRSGANRGAEPAHPKGSHGFIKKAKLAARNKNKKIQQETLDNIMKDLTK